MAEATTKHRWLCAGLLFLTVLFYAPFLEGPWIYEDANWLQAVEHPVEHWMPPSRALTSQTYYWTWRQVGREPALYRAADLALHVGNGALVYTLASALALSGPAALWATGLFLLHPLNSEAVRYVASRGDVLVTTFLLLAVWLSLGPPRVWRWLLVGAALAGAAVSKETGLIGLPLVAITIAIWHPKRAASVLVAPLWVGFGLIVGATFSRLLDWATLAPTAGGSFFTWPQYAALQMQAVWQLLALVPWPHGFSIDHDIVGLGPRALIVSTLLTVQAVALLVGTWRRAPVVAWTVAWVVIAVAPRFVFQTNDFITEPQMYAAMVAVSIGTGAGLARLLAWQPSLSLHFWRDVSSKWQESHLADQPKQVTV